MCVCVCSRSILCTMYSLQQQSVEQQKKMPTTATHSDNNKNNSEIFSVNRNKIDHSTHNYRLTLTHIPSNRVICVYNLSRFSALFTVFFRILCSALNNTRATRENSGEFTVGVCVCVWITFFTNSYFLESNVCPTSYPNGHPEPIRQFGIFMTFECDRVIEHLRIDKSYDFINFSTAQIAMTTTTVLC